MLDDAEQPDPFISEEIPSTGRNLKWPETKICVATTWFYRQIDRKKSRMCGPVCSIWVKICSSFFIYSVGELLNSLQRRTSGASWSEITNLQIFLDSALFLMRVCETTTLISSANPSLQNMDATGFRVCLKELYETRYDPVSVGYVVLGGQSMQKALDFMIANCHVFIRSSFTNYVICTDVTCNHSLAFFI